MPFSIEWKLWAFLIGWLLPVFWALHERAGSNDLAAKQGEVRFPSWIFWLIIPAAFTLRVTWFGDLPNWPIYDEMINGYFAMKLDQHWDWHPFFFWTQLPPLLIWTLAGLFKVLPSTLIAIHILPLLISLLILPFAYGAVRLFFSRATACLYLALVSTGFGFLYFGRLCHQGLLLLLWEFIGFYTLGRYLKATSRKEKAFWLILSGVVIGTGFYTYFSWPAVALMLTVPILWKFKNDTDHRERNEQVLLFGTALLLSLLPLIAGYWQGQFGTYYSFMFHDNRQGDIWSYLERMGNFLSGFLWGCSLSGASYVPIWGGLLNPILDGFLVLGSCSLSRRTSTLFSQWFYVSLIVFLLPHLLSGGPVSEMRVIQCLPLLYFLALVGFEALLSGLKERPAVLVAAILLTASAGLDFYHLSKAREYFNHHWEFQKTKEYYNAFPLLKAMDEKKGPGLVLCSLDATLFHDYSLRIACYPFNVGDNPTLKGHRPSWVAVVTNAHFRPYLEKQFPDGKWYELTDEEGREKNDYTGGKVLAILPINERTGRTVQKWVDADRMFEGVLEKVIDMPLDPGRVEAIHQMRQLEPSLTRDRWIRSCYWEILFELNNWQNGYGQASPQNFAASLESMQKAIQEGYPTAYFYNELGSLYYLEGKVPEAEKAFEKAVHSSLDLTPARENLELLEKMKQGQTPASH